MDEALRAAALDEMWADRLADLKLAAEHEAATRPQTRP